MNKSELIEELSIRTGHNPKLTDKTVRIFFNRIKEIGEWWFNFILISFMNNFIPCRTEIFILTKSPGVINHLWADVHFKNSKNLRSLVDLFIAVGMEQHSNSGSSCSAIKSGSTCFPIVSVPE